MPNDDTRFLTYLKAFFTDWLSGMSGPLSVPFGALALWVSSSWQKAVWASLALACFGFSSYRVWRKERASRVLQLQTKAQEIEAAMANRDAQILQLREQITVLIRKPYSDDLTQTANETIDKMSKKGLLLLRELLMREQLQLGKIWLPDISIGEQNAQMQIATENGLVRLRERSPGAMITTYYVLNPQFRPVLEDVLYEKLERAQQQG